ncbi:saccharopine dehydrogenase NADP-binding domain-containing protein [Streptomyces sp. NPDC049555]|uniref:saccharopine dehydrogenase family protein n=1 Tax=unclassified Streptomyces TaxID=2593676 RepID=UPI003420EFC5
MNERDRSERPYDIVLFGATGFVGELTAAYLLGHAPHDCRLALAGRNRDKLERLRDRLAEQHPERAAALTLVQAEADDPAALRALAESTRVVASTVGPYIVHGQELVAACARAGTDYTDLTGEPEFVDSVFVRHDALARRTGARLVHSCGFDSLPHDLGAYFTVQQLPEGVPLTVDGFVSARGLISGGTLASSLVIASRQRQAVAAARERREHEQLPAGRRIRTPLGVPRFSKETGAWALPLPTIDPQVVRRSALALDRYGPDFRYRHHASVTSLPVALTAPAALATFAALAQLPPVRSALGKLYPPGRGPSEQQRARSWFRVRFVGEGGGRRVFTEVAGGDAGYGETSKMLAHSSLSLALDDLPETAGQVTAATAMGDALIARLTAAGITFRLCHAR